MQGLNQTVAKKKTLKKLVSMNVSKLVKNNRPFKKKISLESPRKYRKGKGESISKVYLGK